MWTLKIIFCALFLMHYTNLNCAQKLMEKNYKVIRLKPGTEYTLKCNDFKEKSILNTFKWQFQPCEIKFEGLDCKSNKTLQWTTLKNYKINHKSYKIRKANYSNSGFFRCLENDIERKVFLVEIDTTAFKWDPPVIKTLETNNFTMDLFENEHVILKCTISSQIPPKVVWFKENAKNPLCAQFEDNFVIKNKNCSLPLKASDHTISNGNVNMEYVSKLNIFNAKEVDSGRFLCVAVTKDGIDYRHINIRIQRKNKFRIRTLGLFASKNFTTYLYMVLIILCVLIFLLIVVNFYCKNLNRGRNINKNSNHHLQNLMSPQTISEISSR